MSVRSMARTVPVTVTAAFLVLGCCAVVPPQGAVATSEPPPPASLGNVTAPDAHLAAFSAQLVCTEGARAQKSRAGGRLVAVYDRNTGLFRWKLSFSGLKGVPKAGYFHGPVEAGEGAAALLPFEGVLKSPMEGRANLTPAQAANLLSGKWYASIRTSTYPRGGLRGQLVLRE